MAKKKTVVKKTTGEMLDQFLADQAVCFTGTPTRWMGRECVETLVRHRGGVMAEEVDSDLNYLVLGKSGYSQAETLAEDLNDDREASIEIYTEEGFVRMLTPTREELIGLLNGGPKSVEFLCELLQLPIDEWPDLSGADLRDTRFSDATVHADLEKLSLDDVDLRGAHLVQAWLPGLSGANLDGAVFQDCHISGDCEFVRCSMKKASGQRADFGSCDITDADFSGSDLAHADFSSAAGDGAVFGKAILTEADFSLCDLTNADFSAIKGAGVDFGGSKLAKAIFIRADLRGAMFTVADLSDCDFTNADLRGADLTGADLRGAVFKNAKLAGACLQLAEVDLPAIAESSDLPADDVDTVSRVGAKLTELHETVCRASRIEVSLVFTREQVPTKISLTCAPRHVRANWEERVEGSDDIRHKLLRTSDVRAAMLSIAQRFQDAEIELDQVEVRSVKSPVTGKQLKRLALGAICETLGVAVPEEPSPVLVKPTPPPAPEEASPPALPPMAPEERKEFLLGLLKGGSEGVQKWNALSDDDRETEDMFHSIDLSATILDGALLRHLELNGADLSKSSLTGADFSYCDLRGASLTGAKIDGVKVWGAVLQDADLAKCSLAGSVLRFVNLKRANLRGADLSNATLVDCNLRGADLSRSQIAGASFAGSQYDESTVWPKDFDAFNTLKWAGEGPDPAAPPPAPGKTPGASVDLTSFVRKLEDHVSSGKLDKALGMLKTESFRLFADVGPDSLSGVVVSEAEPAYGCHVGADGEFGCCNTSLNVCPGLRGSVCKHILVLIIGLVRAGRLDPSVASQWIAATTEFKTQLNKKLMSASFEKLENAQSGEVEWPATETQPEDVLAT